MHLFYAGSSPSFHIITFTYMANLAIRSGLPWISLSFYSHIQDAMKENLKITRATVLYAEYCSHSKGAVI